MPQLSRKRVKFAWALQSAEGTPALQGAQIALPLPAGFKYGSDPHYSFVDYAGGNPHDYIYVEEGTWQEGEFRIPLIPGYCEEIAEWIMARDAYDQAKWATLWLDFGTVTRKWYDVKVKQATFTFKGGARPELQLSLQGKRAGTGEAITVDAPEAWEYRAKEVALQSDYDGSTLVVDTTIRGLTIEIDNKLESPQDGMRIAAVEYPISMDNDVGQTVTGTIERDYSSNDLVTALVARAKGALTVTATRGGNVLTLTLPSIVYTGSDTPEVPESGFVKESVAFHAVGSADGETGPLTIAET